MIDFMAYADIFFCSLFDCMKTGSSPSGGQTVNAVATYTMRLAGRPRQDMFRK